MTSFLALGAVTGVLAAVQDRPVVFVHATVIDARSPAPRLDQTVIVAGRRITDAGPAATVRAPRGARVIDASGKYLIPGLWDMHVHTTMPAGREVLWLYLANGVTGVRDLADDWNVLTGWRREIAAGTLAGPRIVASGPYLEGGDQPIPHLLVKTPADAAPAVDSLVRLGVDFIKVHSQLDRDRWFAIARAARARGVPFVGHVPRVISPIEAADSGVRSIEHLLTIPNQCTADEMVSLAPRYPVQGALGRCSTEDLAPVVAALRRNDTWVVPTLTAQLEVAQWPREGVPGDSFARYLPDSLRKFVAEIFPVLPNLPADADVVGMKLFQKRVAVTGALHRAGVGVLPGTDAPLRNSVPGFGLIQELGYFVQAGMSPFEALSAATLGPARFLRMADSLGTVEAGKLADLVLLAANPLQDIGHLSRVSMVVANGRVFELTRDRAGWIAIVPRR